MGGNKNRKKDKQKSSKVISHENEEIENPHDANPQETAHDFPEIINKPKKREYSDDESDVEIKPKRKKKKKKPSLESSAPGKGKKSIRQMKKEKFAQRQAEAETAAKDTLKQQCLNYLSQWKYANNQWKFMKAKQVWLLKNKFSCKLIPEETWPLLLQYFESAKGNIRSILLEDSNKIIKQMDESSELQRDENESLEDLEDSVQNKPDDTSYKRARDIIQHLHE